MQHERAEPVPTAGSPAPSESSTSTRAPDPPAVVEEDPPRRQGRPRPREPEGLLGDPEFRPWVAIYILGSALALDTCQHRWRGTESSTEMGPGSVSRTQPPTCHAQSTLSLMPPDQCPVDSSTKDASLTVATSTTSTTEQVSLSRNEPDTSWFDTLNDFIANDMGFIANDIGLGNADLVPPKTDSQSKESEGYEPQQQS